MMTGVYPHQHLITGNDPPGNAKAPQSRAAMVSLFRKSKTIAGELSMGQENQSRDALFGD